MLLSLQHRFIFIHIYKTAGTSLTHALRPYARGSLVDRLLITARFRQPAIPRLPDHVSARELRDAIPPSVFATCFKFAFVRNPWDWQVSLFHYMRELKHHPQHDIVKSMTFPEYIEWRVRCDKHLQKDFVSDDRGNILVDYVGRFERLEEDARAIFDRLGIRASVPHHNRSRHEHYRQYYDDHTRALIEEHFRDDIDAFGYSF